MCITAESLFPTFCLVSSISAFLSHSVSLFDSWASWYRQLATRGLGCDHKRINPSSQGSAVDDGRAEDARMAMRATAGRRWGNNVAEFIRASFFQQSRHVGDECDLPRRTFLGDPRYSVMSQYLEGTIKCPLRVDTTSSRNSSVPGQEILFANVEHSMNGEQRLKAKP